MTGPPPPGSPGPPPGVRPPGGPPPSGHPAGPPPAPPPKPRSTKVVVLIAAGLALVLIGGAGVAGVLLVPSDDSESETEIEEPLGIDDPRTSDPVRPRGGTGGRVGGRLLEAAESAGFSCDQVLGDMASRTRCHHTETEGPVPTVQQMEYRSYDDEVVEMSVELEVDPAWRGVPEVEPDDDESGFGQNPDYDVRGEAGELLTMMGSLTVPEPEAGAVGSAVGAAMMEADGEIDTDTFAGSVSMRGPGGSLTLRRVSDDEDLTTSGRVQRGLWHVRGVDAEQVLEKHGMSCDRGQETSTCTGDDLESKVTFPRPHGNGDHTITEISLIAPAQGNQPVAAQVAAAQSIAAMAVEGVEDPEEVRNWVQQECFGTATVHRSVAGQTVTCTPELEGSVGSPDVVSYTFEIT